MTNNFSVVGVAGLGVAINTTYTIAHHHDPFPTILAGSMFMGGCVLVGSAHPQLGTALASVYLLSTVLTRGEYFVGFLSDLTTSAPTQGKKK